MKIKIHGDYDDFANALKSSMLVTNVTLNKNQWSLEEIMREILITRKRIIIDLLKIEESPDEQN